MPPDTLTEDAQSSYSRLATTISVALARAEAHAKATHERFNIFSTLLKDTDEVRLHTRFLHCLLDPKGTHDCGTLFLDLFLQTLTTEGVLNKNGNALLNESDQKPVDFTHLSQGRQWCVHKEASRSPYGQIDLLLESSGLFGIAIENKINAGEQDGQLSGYGSYLRSRYEENSFHLIYLTIDGKQGYSAGDHNYLRISYKRHILQWLEACLQATYSIVPIYQVIIQYRAVVRRLTHKTLENEFMKPVLDFIRENPEIVRLNDTIQVAISQASNNAWERLKERIKSTFRDEYEISFNQEKNWGSNSSNGAALILKAHAILDLHHANMPVWIEPDFVDDECLGIGVCMDGLERSASMTDLFQKMRAGMEGHPQHFFFFPKDGIPRYPIGWSNLMKGSYAEQSAQLLSDSKIDAICQDIRDYLSRLTDAYNNSKSAIGSHATSTP